MDLQDFNGDDLYFDEQLPEQVAHRLADAARRYAGGTAEQPLLEAQELAPDSLIVLVGLYRFYYYQHRYQDALAIAARAMACVAPRLGLPPVWRDVRLGHLAYAVEQGIGLLRFYLLSLKGAGYLCLRLGHFEQGKAMLAKVVELDAGDRLGARLLLDVLAENDAEILPFPTVPAMETQP
ncbi:hypothetical protein [Stutzerimonas kirkiae]|uniref:Tetratricopeptide repeat protein n=1 Tax=Stutzerimonas kirkiae TaxID=2211392 RepID=A0A4Q9RES5_9GAMM|nr:hypothetical protein [Stutzerimonas kirkiae]TBU98791.1 hypothetical protein DNJ96_03500 [Stutzerimonas kirkiae]TBV03885.1 hypothetical protein DNJ95_05910 [Stutzerimonas kirkiae]TBV09701.1 hypothetical protein DNK08_08730 [Stutzerimonas kirkiae]TBV16765.1 hypothetical protein DNK01_02620 [Stutzerimonas kirkiae]